MTSSVAGCRLDAVAGWREVEGSAPELAAAVRATFAARKHATMATIRRDGSPRISGTEVDFAGDGEIYLGMMPGTRRAADLRRDPRLALHAPTVDPPPRLTVRSVPRARPACGGRGIRTHDDCHQP